MTKGKGDVGLPDKQRRRQSTSTFLVNAEDTPSGNLLTTAAPALVTEPAAASAASAAAAAAMVATETEPAEAAEVVQARSPPLSSF